MVIRLHLPIERAMRYWISLALFSVKIVKLIKANLELIYTKLFLMKRYGFVVRELLPETGRHAFEIVICLSTGVPRQSRPSASNRG